MTLFGFIKLPVIMTEVRRTEYREKTTVMTEEEAALAARTKMYSMIAEACSDGELLSSRSAGGVSDGEYRLTCVITVLRDIGKELPVPVSQIAGE